MSSIFISHASSDIKFVNDLKHSLEALGFPVWLAETGLIPSEGWWNAIERRIEDCEACVVVMTPQAKASRWVMREILYAEWLEKPIFPVWLKGDMWPRLAEIQVADLRNEIGSVLPDELVRGLRQCFDQTLKREHLLKCLTDTALSPDEREKAGQELALLGDPRPGVGLDKENLPEIDWVPIPAGEFIYQADEKCERLTLPTFYMARYPITAGQFQVFVDDENGANNPAWWQGLALLKPQSLIAQTFRFSNHPRDSVSWYQAVAFCRWLSAQGGYQVRLPTEQEWEKAARGPDGRVYAWGNDYFSGYANLDETIANMSHPEGVGPYHLSGTSTVGIYPQGASPYGLLDMCGNVWEWCLNTDRVPEAIRPDGEYRRVLRGGAWHFRLDYAQTTTRYLRGPLLRSYDIGFRVVCDSPQ